MKSEFEVEQITVIAGSVDEKEKVKELIDKIGITYPVAYGLNFEELSKIMGAFYEKERKILHATGFLIRPDKTIAVACYSSGPIGRLAAGDVLNLVRFYKTREKSSILTR